MLPVKPHNCNTGCPEDLECVPFKARFRLLTERNQTLGNLDSTTFKSYNKWGSEPCNGFLNIKDEEKNKPQGLGISPASCAGNAEDHLTPVEKPHDTAAAVNQNSSEAFCEDASKTSCICSSKPITVDSLNGSARGNQLQVEAPTLKDSLRPVVPVKVKIESCDVKDTISSQDSFGSFNCPYEEGDKVKDEISDRFDDKYDCIVLSRRRRMLLSRMVKRPLEPLPEGCSGELSNLSSERAVKQSVIRGMHQCKSVQKGCLMDGQSCIGGNAYNICPSVGSKNEIASRSFAMGCCSPSLSDECRAADSVESRSSATFAPCESEGCQDALSSGIETVAAQTLSSPVRVKVEPSDTSEQQIPEKGIWDNCGMKNNFIVKSELRFFEEAPVDELDHLPLIERISLLPSGTSSCLNTFPWMKPLDSAVEVVESVRPIKVDRPRKRTKTATDSAEIALEEDAPELLKVLVEKGVSVAELKLYGGIGGDDVDDFLSEDSFQDLEAVVSQLFAHHSFLKFPQIRCVKASKASYCLACLLSLVEQTRYLRARSWPVEWGWCRDLQSFVFIFPKHNRIVLERPEYGYATYFFELLNSLPVDWQIRRLVITMKLTINGRLALVENKALEVGKDLSEGEAQVLAEYGWIPNTGLGTMLNYRDRVYHDRKRSMEPYEWRTKIGKLLMDGYNGGNLVSIDVPKKLLDYQLCQSPQVKVELEDVET